MSYIEALSWQCPPPPRGSWPSPPLTGARAALRFWPLCPPCEPPPPPSLPPLPPDVSRNSGSKRTGSASAGAEPIRARPGRRRSFDGSRPASASAAIHSMTSGVSSTPLVTFHRNAALGFSHRHLREAGRRRQVASSLSLHGSQVHSRPRGAASRYLQCRPEVLRNQRLRLAMALRGAGFLIIETWQIIRRPAGRSHG